ncbi:phosphoribosylamine--glycine ligase, partial [Candidatus Micrarchaeota archaeon]|nr:phosphoribosylamine--glycine ligase [Candidatus Micrarchaeota archaeon]MBU1939162.1 phosphoribosylamine--glycine ligase [Candidatus Micrarchaeota archaeon]
MRILVVGGGGREHALVWKLSQSKGIEKIYCAPGNAGIAELAECVDIAADNVKALAEFAKDKGIALTVVGPEAALCAGIADEFEKLDLRLFGPGQAAAEIEGSKAFAKELMRKYEIPTAEFGVFDSAEKAIEYINQNPAQKLVVKVEGLAAGKGVLICESKDEAIAAVNKVMVENAFGEAGKRVVVEEFLEGEEASYLVFTDGDTVVPMVTSQDHKRALDGDMG